MTCDEEPDRTGSDRAVRRALLVGGAAWVLVGGALGVRLAERGGQASAAGVLAGLALGCFLASLWLVATWLLDLVTRRPTPRSRLWWTFGLLVMTFLTPLLAMSAATLAD